MFNATYKMMKTINYFGYGANADPAMMKAITGNANLVARPASLWGYKLVIQGLDQIPPNPRRILEEAWGPSFRTYAVIPQERSIINGVLWRIDEEERRLIRNWELVEEEVGPELAWREEGHPSPAYFQNREGTIYGVTTEFLGHGQAYDESADVDGRNYPLFLMPREDVLRAAEAEREEFLARIGKEGRPPTKER